MKSKPLNSECFPWLGVLKSLSVYGLRESTGHHQNKQKGLSLLVTRQPRQLPDSQLMFFLNIFIFSSCISSSPTSAAVSANLKYLNGLHHAAWLVTESIRTSALVLTKQGFSNQLCYPCPEKLSSCELVSGTERCQRGCSAPSPRCLSS